MTPEPEADDEPRRTEKLDETYRRALSGFFGDDVAAAKPSAETPSGRAPSSQAASQAPAGAEPIGLDALKALEPEEIMELLEVMEAQPWPASGASASKPSKPAAPTTTPADPIEATEPSGDSPTKTRRRQWAEGDAPRPTEVFWDTAARLNALEDRAAAGRPPAPAPGAMPAAGEPPAPAPGATPAAGHEPPPGPPQEPPTRRDETTRRPLRHTRPQEWFEAGMEPPSGPPTEPPTEPVEAIAEITESSRRVRPGALESAAVDAALDDLLGPGDPAGPSAASLDQTLPDAVLVEPREATDPEGAPASITATGIRRRQAEEDEASIAALPAPFLPGSQGSRAVLLEPGMGRAPSDAGPFFERYGSLPSMPSPVRPGAALEIGSDRIRYLELQPAGDRLIAMRYESVTIDRVTGDLAARSSSILDGLARLHRSLAGRIVPCTVVFEDTKTTARVVAVQTLTRHIARLSSMELLGLNAVPTDELTTRRNLAKLRMGSPVWRTVLVTSSLRSEVEGVTHLLQDAGIPVARVSTGQLSFLESVVPFTARADEDSAEALVSIEPSGVTVCLCARGVPILSQTFPLSEGFNSRTSDLNREVTNGLNKVAKEFELTCGTLEISRVRFLCGLRSEGSHDPAATLSSLRLGRPIDPIDPEALFKIDLTSVETLGVPADAMAVLAAPAFEAATSTRSVAHEQGKASRRAKVGVWLANAAACLAVSAVLLARGDRVPADLAHKIEHVRALESRVEKGLPLLRERAELQALRDARVAVERDRAIVASFGGTPARAPDVPAVLSELVLHKPSDLYVTRVRVAPGPGEGPWELELDGVAVPANGTPAAAIALSFVAALRAAPRIESLTSIARPDQATAGQVVLEARARLRVDEERPR